jgi:hypothetical protein
MRRLLRLQLVTLLALAAGCDSAPRTPPPSYPAEAAIDTLVAAVAAVAQAVRRSDGTWVLLAPQELQVIVADFAADTVRPHPGITPEMVPGATMLFASGDTIFVGDFGLRRVTAWLSDGRRVDAMPTPDALRGAIPRARDAAGQWYFELTSPPASAGGIRDSGAVVRADPLLAGFDTVARLAPPELAEVQEQGRIVLQPLALAGRDRWGVLRDGTLWVARVHNNQVWWYPPAGEPRHTRPMQDAIIPVAEMDRQLYLRRFPEEQRPSQSLLRFALIKPPFERAFDDPTGRVWLFKSAPALDSIRRFQVADAAGWSLSVALPTYGTALGVADGEILVGEDFPGGTRLLRFTIPAEAWP